MYFRRSSTSIRSSLYDFSTVRQAASPKLLLATTALLVNWFNEKDKARIQKLVRVRVRVGARIIGVEARTRTRVRFKSGSESEPE